MYKGPEGRIFIFLAPVFLQSWLRHCDEMLGRGDSLLSQRKPRARGGIAVDVTCCFKVVIVTCCFFNLLGITQGPSSKFGQRQHLQAEDQEIALVLG